MQDIIALPIAMQAIFKHMVFDIASISCILGKDIFSS